MPTKEILRIGNRIHVTLISYFHLQLVSKSVSRKILGLKMVKLDCITIQFKKLEMSWMEPVVCLLLILVSVHVLLKEILP